MARAYATLGVWAQAYGQAPLPITSGRRSRAHQKELRRRWDAGDRAGLVARPALDSAHVRGEAFDLRQGPALLTYARLAHHLGLRWGGTFQDPDPVHFDVGQE